MPFSYFPVSSGEKILKDWFLELAAAINERSQLYGINAVDTSQLYFNDNRIIQIELVAAIQSGVGYLLNNRAWDVTNDQAYTRSSIMTQLGIGIGGSYTRPGGLSGSPQKEDKIIPEMLNEPYLIVKSLSTFKFNFDSGNGTAYVDAPQVGNAVQIEYTDHPDWPEDFYTMADDPYVDVITDAKAAWDARTITVEAVTAARPYCIATSENNFGVYLGCRELLYDPDPDNGDGSDRYIEQAYEFTHGASADWTRGIRKIDTSFLSGYTPTIAYVQFTRSSYSGPNISETMQIRVNSSLDHDGTLAGSFTINSAELEKRATLSPIYFNTLGDSYLILCMSGDDSPKTSWPDDAPYDEDDIPIIEEADKTLVDEFGNLYGTPENPNNYPEESTYSVNQDEEHNSGAGSTLDYLLISFLFDYV